MTFSRRRLLLSALVAAAATVRGSTPAYAQAQGEEEYDPQAEGVEDVAVAPEGDAYADTDPSALTDFRPALDPHGTWVDEPDYGTVWMPNAEEVGADFQPYVTNGSWAYDDDEVWVSGYDWGWVAFHYGRWTWIVGRRWVWIPGREYAGAWVEWRVGPAGYGYVGWGPLAPRFGWRGGMAIGFGAGFIRSPPVVFCAREDLFAPRIGGRVIFGERAGLLVSETRPYVRAEPMVPGRPVLRGPMPGVIGIEPGRVVRVGPADGAVLRARAFARPSTAAPFGARPPTPHVVRTRVRVRATPGAAAAPRVIRSAPVHAGGGRGRR